MECVEIQRTHLACALCSKIIAPARRHLEAASIWRSAYVVVSGACRIYFDMCFQPFVFNEFFQNTLRGRRATDIAKANHQNADFGPAVHRSHHALVTRQVGTNRFKITLGIHSRGNLQVRHSDMHSHIVVQGPELLQFFFKFQL